MRYEQYKISKLFKSQNGDTDIKKSDITGTGVPVITSGVDKYGVMGQTDIEAQIIKENTITIDMFGNTFFRPFQYKMVTHARVFSMELIGREMNELIGLFLVTQFHWLPKVYSYSNMCSFNKIKDSTITLPTLDELDENSPYSDEGFVPDWKYMEKRVAELEELRVAELAAYLEETGLSDYILTDEEETLLLAEPENVEFNIGDLFDVEKWTYGKNKNWLSKYDDYQDGRTPVISGITKNNGIIYYTEDEYDDTEIQQPCLTITTRGEYSGTVFYHDEPFLLANNVLTLPISNVTKNQQLFLATLIMKLGYGGYNNYPTKEKLAGNYIPLPIQTDEHNNPIIDPERKHHPEGYIPDWDFMERYIRAIEKVVIADVVKYKDDVIAKTKEIISKDKGKTNARHIL